MKNALLKTRGFPGTSYWLHILIWTFLLLFPFLVANKADNYMIGSLPGLFFLISGVLHMALFYSNAFIWYPLLYTLRTWYLYIVFAIVLVLSVIVLKRYILVTWFELQSLNAIMWRLIAAPTGITLLASIVYRNMMDKRITENRIRQQQEEQMAAELKFLRGQINPHFIFNVLTNIITLARKKSDQLEPSLLMLSSQMRYMLYDTRQGKIPVDKEIEYLKDYIALQRLRFGDFITIHTEIIGNTDAELTIEPMLLVPFVENAFKHGITDIEKPWISIRLVIRATTLLLEVKNSFTDNNSHTESRSGIGIENVQSRLKMIYGEKQSLDIIKDQGVFIVRLQLQLL